MSEFRHIGKVRRRQDGRAIVTGKALYAMTFPSRTAMLPRCCTALSPCGDRVHRHLRGREAARRVRRHDL